MINYGFSLWLVPQSRYNINTSHIPHITVATCFYDGPPQVQCTRNKRYRVKFFEGISQFPADMYDKETPIGGIGVYCKIDNMDLDHEPHMTLSYDENENVSNIKLPEFAFCDLYLADTRDSKPENWKLLKKY